MVRDWMPGLLFHPADTTILLCRCSLITYLRFVIVVNVMNERSLRATVPHHRLPFVLTTAVLDSMGSVDLDCHSSYRILLPQPHLPFIKPLRLQRAGTRTGTRTVAPPAERRC